MSGQRIEGYYNHENDPLRPLTVASATDPWPPLLCFEIHHFAEALPHMGVPSQGPEQHRDMKAETPLEDSALAPKLPISFAKTFSRHAVKSKTFPPPPSFFYAGLDPHPLPPPAPSPFFPSKLVSPISLSLILSCLDVSFSEHLS